MIPGEYKLAKDDVIANEGRREKLNWKLPTPGTGRSKWVPISIFLK